MGISQQIGASSLIKPGVIDNTAARPASPYEGQVIFQKDTDQLLVWNGTAWVIPNSPAQNPTGLELVSTTTLSAFSTNITNCFTSTYTNYRILFSYIGSTANACYIRFLVGSTVQTGNILSSNFGTQQSAAATIVGSSRSDQYALFSTAYTVYPSTTTIDVFSPQAVGYTSYAGFGQLGLSSSDSYGVNLYGRNIATTQIDGFELTTATGASVLTGTVRVYGYRNS